MNLHSYIVNHYYANKLHHGPRTTKYTLTQRLCLMKKEKRKEKKKLLVLSDVASPS